MIAHGHERVEQTLRAAFAAKAVAAVPLGHRRPNDVPGRRPVRFRRSRRLLTTDDAPRPQGDEGR